MSYIKRWLEDGCPADAEYQSQESEGIDFTIPATIMMLSLLLGMLFVATIVFILV